MIKWRVVTPQLPAKYPQLPALLIGQILTLIWRIAGAGQWRGAAACRAGVCYRRGVRPLSGFWRHLVKGVGGGGELEEAGRAWPAILARLTYLLIG